MYGNGRRAFTSAAEPAPGVGAEFADRFRSSRRSEEHTSELQSLAYLVCRLLLEKKKLPEKILVQLRQYESHSTHLIQVDIMWDKEHQVDAMCTQEHRSVTQLQELTPLVLLYGYQ